MLLPKGSKTLNAPGPTPHRGELLSRRPVHSYYNHILYLSSEHRRKLSSNSPRPHLPLTKEKEYSRKLCYLSARQAVFGGTECDR